LHSENVENKQCVIEFSYNVSTFFVADAGQANVGPSVRPSLAVRCPSRDHILKTKQDRTIVTMESTIEVGTADSVTAFRSSPNAPGKIF